jgi:hypothetical protein
MANRPFVQILRNSSFRPGSEALHCQLHSGLDPQGEKSRELWILGRFSL